MATTSITSYKQTVMDVTSDLNLLRDFCLELKLDPSVEGIDEVRRRLAEDEFNVVIVGEFKRGKSTLINALLEQSILPADVLPCSATLNRVTYGIDPHAVIEYRDGSSEEIPVDELEDYVTKLTPESEQRAANVKSATVYYPISFCKNGVTIIDTPGLNDDAAMTEVTLGVLPEADAAIMVMMCGSPFSESEREFLENKIMAADLGRVLFVVTGIDRYDEEEQEKLLELFRRRITDSVLNKAKKVYGEDSPEYATYQRKLGSIKIYPVSARNALRAKAKNDAQMLAESRFPEFEEGLMDFLVRDRGALQLSAPVNRARSTAAEVLKAIELRASSLGMDQEEFDTKYAEAMAQIDEIREQRSAEMAKITAAADEAYQQLLPLIDDFWANLESAADAAVDSYEITDIKQLKNEATQEELGKAVANAMQNESQLFAERVQHTIEQAAVDEIERLGSFEQYFFDATARMQDSFAPQESGESTGSIVGTAFADFAITGMGSAYAGYKTAGWKGALLGGGVGLLGTLGGVLVTAMGLAAVGVTAGPALLLAEIGSSILGTSLSRKAIDYAFKDHKIEQFRTSYKDAVREEIERMQAEEDFPGKVREQVHATFDALKQQVTTETETVLANTQGQLNELKVELATSKDRREQESGRLAEIAERATQVLERANALEAELSRVLAATA